MLFIGRGDFYFDLSERNREACCQKQRGILFFLRVPGSPLSFSVSFSVSSSPLSFSVSFSVYSSPLSPVPTLCLLCLPFWQGFGFAKLFLETFWFHRLSFYASLSVHSLPLFVSILVRAVHGSGQVGFGSDPWPTGLSGRSRRSGSSVEWVGASGDFGPQAQQHFKTQKNLLKKKKKKTRTIFSISKLNTLDLWDKQNQNLDQSFKKNPE